MSENKKIRVSCRGLLVDQGRVLLLNIDDRDYWSAPGGGYEESDGSLVQTVVREMKEEAGMDVVVDRLVYVQEFSSKGQLSLILFYLLSAKDVSQYREYVTDPDNPSRKTRVKWFKIDGEEYKKIDFLPKGLQNTLAKVISNEVSISVSNIL